MHRGFPWGNTKSVLILFPALGPFGHWAGSSRIPSQSCFTDPELHDPSVVDVLTTYSIRMHMKCQLMYMHINNADIISQTRSNYRPSIKATILI